MEIDYFLPIFIDYRPVPAKTGDGVNGRMVLRVERKYFSHGKY